jgi:phosphate transport system substrate-binding protein
VAGVADDGCTEGDLSTPCAIGYFGFAYYQQNSDRLSATSIDGVAPSADTVNDNSYELSRPLFMYTAESVIAEKPQVAEFIAYYLEHVNDVIGEVGYFPAHEDDLQGAADALKAAAGW